MNMSIFDFDENGKVFRLQRSFYAEMLNSMRVDIIKTIEVNNYENSPKALLIAITELLFCNSTAHLVIEKSHKTITREIHLLRACKTKETQNKFLREMLSDFIIEIIAYSKSFSTFIVKGRLPKNFLVMDRPEARAHLQEAIDLVIDVMDKFRKINLANTKSEMMPCSKTIH